MCGLLGMLTSNQNAADFVAATERALPCMRHRDPDEDGTWFDTDVCSVLTDSPLSISPTRISLSNGALPTPPSATP